MKRFRYKRVHTTEEELFNLDEQGQLGWMLCAVYPKEGGLMYIYRQEIASSEVKTEVVESLNGHSVKVSIDHQSFYLREQTSEPGMSSLDHAKWYETQVKVALNRLKQ